MTKRTSPCPTRWKLGRRGNYNGIAAGSVIVSINDNDTEGVTVSETGLTIVEGQSKTYTVVLDTQPAGTVTVTVSGHAGTDASLDKTTLTFSTTNWSTAQEVTVTAGQDGDADDEADVTLSHTVEARPTRQLQRDRRRQRHRLDHRQRHRRGDRLQDGADHRGGEQRQLHGGAGHPAGRDRNRDRLGPRRHRRIAGQDHADLQHDELEHGPGGDGDRRAGRRRG